MPNSEVLVRELPYGLAKEEWCDECFMGIHHEGEEAYFGKGTGVVFKGDPRTFDVGKHGYARVKKCGCPCREANNTEFRGGPLT